MERRAKRNAIKREKKKPLTRGNGITYKMSPPARKFINKLSSGGGQQPVKPAGHNVAGSPPDSTAR